VHYYLLEFKAKRPGVLSFSLCMSLFWCQGTHKEEGYSTPTPHLKFSTAGLRIPGENVIDDVPFLYKFWVQKRLFD